MALPAFGARLSQIREQRGLSQRELARRVGVNSKQIWRYERNEAEPTATHLAGIAQVLSVSTDYLLGLVDDEDIYYFAEGLDEFEHQLIEFVRYQPDEHNKIGVPFTEIIEYHTMHYTDVLRKLTKLYIDRQEIIRIMYNLDPYSGIDMKDA
jgi:transcriptional regulator with XRE-family HTH domain